MSRELARFCAGGGASPGVLLVIPQNAPLREVVETLILIWADDHPADWSNLVTKIPFLISRWLPAMLSCDPRRGDSMATEKLKLVVLDGNANGTVVEVQFNPKEIDIQKAIPWQQQPGKGPGDLVYTHNEPRKMSCELLFDGSPTSTSIQGEIDKLQAMSDIDTVLKRPPKLKSRPSPTRSVSARPVMPIVSMPWANTPG
jgi:hypothetical protein